MKNHALKAVLDGLYQNYDYKQGVENDPLIMVQRFDDPKDIEIAGLLCSALAYGRVSLFLPKLSALLDHMLDEGGSLRRYVQNYNSSQTAPFLQGFKYRMSTGLHLHRLFSVLQRLFQEYKSLEALFLSAFDLKHPHIGPALHHFTSALYQGDSPPERAYRHLLPDPAKGSACKRMNLYLRWMIRHQPGLDFGIWTKLPTSHLVMPMDIHTMRMAYNLGLTSRKDASWKTAVQVTEALRQFDPTDPIKYDFSLCHLGISGQCLSKKDVEICADCTLKPLCRWW